MTLPVWLRAVLPGDTADTWEAIRGVVPDAAYLAGGTARSGPRVHGRSRQPDPAAQGQIRPRGRSAQRSCRLGRPTAGSIGVAAIPAAGISHDDVIAVLGAAREELGDRDG